MARSAWCYHLSTNSRLGHVLAAWLSSCSTHCVISETICLMCSSCRMTHLCSLQGNNGELSKRVFMLPCEATVCRFCRISKAPSDLINNHKGFFFLVICLYDVIWQICQPLSQICVSGRNFFTLVLNRKLMFAWLIQLQDSFLDFSDWSTVCWKINIVFFLWIPFLVLIQIDLNVQ